VIVPAFAVMMCVLLVGVCRTYVDAEFDSGDPLPLGTLEVRVKVADVQFREFPLEGRRLHAQVAERADRHIAADSGEAIEEKNAHRVTLSLRKSRTSENPDLHA
jgi:hypothetical protein